MAMEFLVACLGMNAHLPYSLHIHNSCALTDSFLDQYTTLSRAHNPVQIPMSLCFSTHHLPHPVYVKYVRNDLRQTCAWLLFRVVFLLPFVIVEIGRSSTRERDDEPRSEDAPRKGVASNQQRGTA